MYITGDITHTPEINNKFIREFPLEIANLPCCRDEINTFSRRFIFSAGHGVNRLFTLTETYLEIVKRKQN